MSMNLFFQAYPQQDVDAMAQDHALVDKWAWDEKRSALSTDIGTAWDVLNRLLAGAGFRSSRFLDDVLSNGCEVIDAALVKEHAARLAGWTPDEVLEALRSLDEDDDLYRLELYRDEEDDLLEEFGKLVAFYREAAARELAVIHYAA
jgi:hypothetical protein